MPRPRLSLDQARLKGALAVNKGRFADRQKSPATQGTLGNPPKHLDDATKKVWRELAKAIPAGVAGSSDRMTVEIASCLLTQFRAAPVTMQASRIALLMQLLSRLGLDPQARTRMQVPTAPETPDDEWSYLAPTPNAQRTMPVM